LSSLSSTNSPSVPVERELLLRGDPAARADSRVTAKELVPVPVELLQNLEWSVPVFLTTELWDRFVVAPQTAPEQSRGARVGLLLLVTRSILAQMQPGRDFAAFSFQVKNRPLHWDTVHAWVAVRVEQPDGLPALVIGLERLDEHGAI
jgi:hypothetical protein